MALGHQSTSAFVILIVLFCVWCSDAAVNSVKSNSVLLPLKCNPSSTGLTDSGDNDITETTVEEKAPIVGKIHRIKPGYPHYGFIERSYRPVHPLINKEGSGAADNHTWRITCNPGRSIFVVVMNLQLAGEDYLQVKLTKINGTINHHFHSMYFSKKSILVTLGGNNRDIFTTQSTFLLGYVCVGNTDTRLKEAEKFLNSPKVLQYMRCRPHTFEMLAKELVKTDKLITYPGSDDMVDMGHLVSPGCIKTPPECTNTLEVMYNTSTEGSAE